MRARSNLLSSFACGPLLLLAACTEPAVGIPVSDEVEPTVTEEVDAPSLQGQPGDVNVVKLKGVTSREELTAHVLPFGKLPPIDQETVTVLMNTIEAPCGPCQGKTLASCLIEMPTGCENLPDLVDRTVRLLDASTGPQDLRTALTYSDIWMPLPDAKRAVDGNPAGVRLEVWVDPSSASIRSVIDTLDALELTDVGVVFRIAPMEESDLSRAWAASAIAAEEQGQLEAFLRAVRTYRDEQRRTQSTVKVALDADDIEMLAVSLIDAGLDKARFDATRNSRDVYVRVDSDQVLARTLELRVAPSWFVDGYRLRGAQSALAIQRVIDMQRDDRRARAAAPEASASGAQGG